MESNEKYLEKYNLKKTQLEQKGEIWRLRFTEKEYLAEIQRLRAYEINSRENSTLNEYHIQRNIENMISVMLMDAYTLEEAKEQTKRHSKVSEEEFIKETPVAIKRLKSIQTPLKFRDSANIYRWIYRKQISINMLSPEVREEFSKTIHYEKLQSIKKI